MKNATEAMKDSKMIEMITSVCTLIYILHVNVYVTLLSWIMVRSVFLVLQIDGLHFKMDFNEFCAAAISVPQFEGLERWELQLHSAYEIFETEGNRVVMIEDLARVSNGIFVLHLRHFVFIHYLC